MHSILVPIKKSLEGKAGVKANHCFPTAWFVDNIHVQSLMALI